MPNKKQWNVTEYGLETDRPWPVYPIAAETLTKVRDDGDGPVYEWLVDLPWKTWIELEDFIEAFTDALQQHAFLLPVDPEILKRSMARCHEVYALMAAYSTTFPRTTTGKQS